MCIWCLLVFFLVEGCQTPRVLEKALVLHFEGYLG